MLTMILIVVDQITLKPNFTLATKRTYLGVEITAIRASPGVGFREKVLEGEITDRCMVVIGDEVWMDPARWEYAV